MQMVPAASPRARQVRAVLEQKQADFADRLSSVAQAAGLSGAFARAEWLRDDGRHGGGHRLEQAQTAAFNRASINISEVHYDDQPEKRLASADALSTIIHPESPLAPSVHMHFSWTELRDQGGSFRLMADLNPAQPFEEDTEAFEAALQMAAGDHYEAARAQGDRYFYIPALDRHRGVTHFYLEAYRGGDFEEDLAFVERVAEAAMTAYAHILGRALQHRPAPRPEDRAQQLAYHTLYLYQVLTLDRGTTSGLLIHDQNDVGIMGSLPSHIDRDLLLSWAERSPPPQDQLVRDLVAALADGSPCPVDIATRQRLAEAVRAHYRAHPEALELQARGDIVPPTVANHETVGG